MWYNSELELSKFDIPVAGQSLANASPSQVRDMFAQNCVRITLEPQEVGCKSFRTGAVFIRGQRLVFNKHTLTSQGRYKMTIQCRPTMGGITSNIAVFFDWSELTLLDECDLVALTVKGVPPRKDITKFWNNAPHLVTYMIGIRRDNDGTCTYAELHNVQLTENMNIEALERRMDVYLGQGSATTKPGDCGALGVAMTPRGPSILGFHTIGRERTAGYPYVSRSNMMKLLGDTKVEGGGVPLFTLNGENPALLPVHHKSVMRYLTEGRLS